MKIIISPALLQLSALTLSLALVSGQTSIPTLTAPSYNQTVYPQVIPSLNTTDACYPSRVTSLELTYLNSAKQPATAASSSSFSQVPSSFSPFNYFYSLSTSSSECGGSLQLKNIQYQQFPDTTCVVLFRGYPIGLCSSSSTTAITLPIDSNQTQSANPGFNYYSIEIVRNKCALPRGQTSYIFHLNHNTTSTSKQCPDVKNKIEIIYGESVVVPGIGMTPITNTTFSNNAAVEAADDTGSVTIVSASSTSTPTTMNGGTTTAGSSPSGGAATTASSTNSSNINPNAQTAATPTTSAATKQHQQWSIVAASAAIVMASGLLL